MGDVGRNHPEAEREGEAAAYLDEDKLEGHTDEAYHEH